jgi:hypothetical protein
VSEKARLEKEETAKATLKHGLEYLNFLNIFFDHKKNAEEQLKLFVRNIFKKYRINAI